MKMWLVLGVLLAASADIAFRWPEGTVSAFATLIFWYLLFIAGAVVAMRIADRGGRRTE